MNGAAYADKTNDLAIVWRPARAEPFILTGFFEGKADSGRGRSGASRAHRRALDGEQDPMTDDITPRVTNTPTLMLKGSGGRGAVATGAAATGAEATGASATGLTLLGSVALGAFALGAVAIGAFAIGG